MKVQKRIKNKSEIFYCVDCNCSWEVYYLGNENKFVKYRHLPTYGLRREKCYGCVEDKIYEAG